MSKLSDTNYKDLSTKELISRLDTLYIKLKRINKKYNIPEKDQFPLIVFEEILVELQNRTTQ